MLHLYQQIKEWRYWNDESHVEHLLKSGEHLRFNEFQSSESTGQENDKSEHKKVPFSLFMLTYSGPNEQSKLQTICKLKQVKYAKKT
eukprot:UN30878